MSDLYNTTKVLWHQDSLDRMRRGLLAVPRAMHLVLSDLCNHDCSFCAYRMSGYTSNALFGEVLPNGKRNNNPNRMITYEKALEIIADAKELGVRAVEFTGGGEPTVHPRHEEIMREACFQRGLKCALVSNGYRWSDQLVHTLSHFAWVRVSLDAGTEETYARVRKVKRTVFRRVLTNIEALARQPKASAEFRLGVGFVVTRENYRELVTAVRLARECGADNVRIGAMFSTRGAGYYDAFREAVRELCAQAMLLQTDAFRVHALFDRRVADLEQGRPDYERCYYQEMVTYIGADLNVYRCCNTAYNPQGLLGSLKEQRLVSLWTNIKTKQAIKQFDARSCERCQFNAQNRLLAASMTPPVHVEFV